MPRASKSKNSDSGGVSQSEIARAWGASRQYVFKCVKAGCPTDSVESATLWRAANQKYGSGYRSKHGGAEEAPDPLVKLQVRSPLDLEALFARLEAAGFSRVEKVSDPGQFAVRGAVVDVFPWQDSRPYRIELNDREIALLCAFDLDDPTQAIPFDGIEFSILKAAPAPEITPQAPATNPEKPPAARKSRLDLVETTDFDGSELTTLEDSLRRAIRIESLAAKLVEDALEDGSEKADTITGIRISVYNKAVEGRQRAERMFREEMERRKILVPFEQAKEWARKGMQTMLDRLQSLPPNIGPQANPEDPIHATNVIAAAIRAVIKEGQRVYAA